MHLNVVTTLRCDFRCAHCVFGCPVVQDLEPGRFEATLDGLAPAGLTSVTFTGGEARLHPDFDALVDATARRDLRFDIVSNGWDIDAYLPAVDRHRRLFAGFHLSVDGLRSTHDRMRRPGSFDRVTEAIALLRDRGIPVGVNTVLTDDSLDELAPVVALCVELGATRVKVAGMIPVSPEAAGLSGEGRLSAWEAIPWLSRRHRIPVVAASSLLGPATTLFCPVLDTRTLSLDARGRITWCCDVPGEGAVLAEPGESTEEVLARLNRVANEIVLDRIGRVRAGGLTVHDRWCLYCHEYFGAHGVD